ncbi:MAG: prolipoprotein diacylglyceryl transferase [Chloroflexota bacterium]
MLDGLSIDPVAFTIPIGGGFPIYWYGILVTLGIALGAIWGAREAQKRNLNVDEFFNGLIIVILSGYIFARLTYVLLEVLGGRGDQFDSLLDIINIRQGGINILGGFIGAAIVGFIYLRSRKLNFWQYADIAGPALLLAQSIGRFGNFINQELYGPPTNLPWGILIDAQHRLPQYSDLTQYPLDTRFHPTFLYESLWLFLGFLVLAYLSSRYRDTWRPGVLFGIFLIWWGSGRFVIEFFRPDQATIGNTPITFSMIMSLALVAAGIWVVLSRSRRLLTSSQRKHPPKPKPNRTA